MLHLGVLIYERVSDFNGTIMQPGVDDLIGKTVFPSLILTDWSSCERSEDASEKEDEAEL